MMFSMEVSGVVERVQRVATVRADAADRSTDELEAALVEVRAVRSWVDAAEAGVVAEIARRSSFPESSIAAASKGSLGEAGRTIDRARTLDAVPGFADALDRGTVTSGHVDQLTRAGASLDAAQREELFERCVRLLPVAEAASTEQWARRVRDEARRIAADDGIDRLERQRRSTALRTWVDAEGMWNLKGRFDPVSGVKIASRLDAAVETLFAEQTPSTCPSDPVEKQHHLRALALCRLLDDSGVSSRPGRAEFVAVIDVDASTGSGPPPVDWPIPVEVPWRVLADLAGDADVHAVVVRNGIVLYAPGTLDLGRTTRTANRAQRRALRGLYATCAIPGCSTHYDRCNLHHVIWWRHGGLTNLDNLLPLCSHHHHKVHDDGWTITLGANRELTIDFPDGRTMTTGPPRRRTAA
jgi:hypothetical protein